MELNKLIAQVRGIWSEVLQVDECLLDMNKHFFLQGGDSLHLMRILNRLNNELRVELNLKDIRSFSTPKRMAECCKHKLQDKLCTKQKLSVNKRSGEYVATGMQQGMWYSELLAEDKALYNNAICLHIKGPLQSSTLCVSITQLFKQYPVLSTRFEVDKKAKLLLGLMRNDWQQDSTYLAEVYQEKWIARSQLEKHIESEAERPFRLSLGPLARFCLFRLEESEFCLLFVCHHAVSDGWSGGIILNSLKRIYAHLLRHESLLDLVPDTGFENYANKSTTLALPHSKLAWWQARFQQADDLGFWPLKKYVVASFAHRTETSCSVIPQASMNRCTSLACTLGVSKFIVMLAACKKVLAAISGQATQVLGVPIAEREYATESSVGCFVHLLPLISSIDLSHAFSRLVLQIDSEFAEARSQLIPFNILVEHVQAEALADKNPIFSILFAFQNFPKLTPFTLNLNIQEHSVPKRHSQYALTIEVMPRDEIWYLNLQYDPLLLSAAHIEQFTRQYFACLDED